MRNRWVLLLAAAIAILMLLIALNPDFSSLFNKNTSTPLSQKEKVWHLRLGHNMPTDSALHQAALLYAKKVAEKTNGKILITIYPNQQLGTDYKMIEMARRGELDIIIVPTAKMGVSIPSMQYVDLPFYFPTREDTYRMLDGEPGKMIFDELKKIDLVGVTFWENGFKHFTADTPLHTPQDFQGKKFRIMQSRLIEAQFNALGAKTLPIDFHKTRQALADGIVDGQENPLIAIDAMKIDEVQKHLTLSNHGYMGYLFAISAKSFTKFPFRCHAVLIDTARELTPYERDQTHNREAALLQKMKEHGMAVYTLNAQERTQFAQKMKPIIPRFEEEIGPHLMAKSDELLLERYGPSPQSHQQIVIGLDADLSSGTKTGALAIKRGIELAIDEINAKGGILGKPLVLITKDDHGVSTQGVENIRSFIGRSDVVAIIGGVLSTVIYESIGETAKPRIPYLIPWATAEKLTRSSYQPNTVFRVSANDRNAIAFMGEYLLNRYSSVAVLYENSLWGRDGYLQLQTFYGKKAKKLSEALMFNTGQTHFEKEIERIKSSGADALFLITRPYEANRIIQTLDQEKVYLPVVTHWGITADHIDNKTLDALKRVDLQVFQTFSFLDSPTFRSQKLARQYMTRYGISSVEAINAPSGVAQAYDLVQLLALAIEKAKSTKRSKVRDALENLPEYQGVIRTYDHPFSPTDHDALSQEDYFLGRFRHDGVIVPITKR